MIETVGNSSLVSNLSETTDDNVIMAIEKILLDYKQKRKIHSIPVSIFTNGTGILESTVKYLKENQELTYAEIAKVLNRDERTIWTSYNKATKKHKDKFSTNGNETTVDVTIFTEREKSPLKAVVLNLKSKGLTLKQIATMLNRNYKTIWLTQR